MTGRNQVYFFFVVLLFVISVCHAFQAKIVVDSPDYSGPGFKTTLTQSGVNYIQEVGINILEQQLHQVTVPDQSGEVDTPIGKVNWYLQNIVVSTLQISSSSISLTPGVGFALSISGMSVDLSAHWHYRKVHWPHIEGSGDADVIIENTDVQVDVQVTATNGQPYVTVTSDGVNIGKLDIKVHGGASWLYNILLDLLKKTIVHDIDKALTNGITTNVNNGVNKVLATLPMKVPLTAEVEISYMLLQNPLFTSSYVTLDQLGEFYSISNPQECPAQYCPVNSLPDIATSDMVGMVVGDYVANSAAYTYWQIGLLKKEIVDADIPPNSPVRLNTSYFEYFLPGLYDKFPNLMMMLSIYCTDSPNFNFSSTGAQVYTKGGVTVYAILPNGTLAEAFILEGWARASGVALLDGQLLYGNLTYLNSDFSLYSSNIGNFNPSILVSLVNLLLTEGVIPKVNSMLKRGIPLPTVPGLTFESPTVGWGDGYINISTDFQYTPPAKNEVKQGHQITLIQE